MSSPAPLILTLALDERSFAFFDAQRRLHFPASRNLIPAHVTLFHHLLGLHHVNETVPREQWIYWDVAFLVWGAAMLLGGLHLLRRGQEETRARAASAGTR